MKVLFVGGLGRNGSTLLDRLLGQVPGVCSVGELAFIWTRGLRDDERCGCGEAFRACPFWTEVGERAFGGWRAVDVAAMVGLQRSVDRNRYIPLMLAPWLAPGYARRMRRYAAGLGALYEAIGQVSGARLIVDSSKHASTAALLRRVPGLGVSIVRLVRDARGVAHSWSKTVVKPEVTGRVEHMPRVPAARAAARWLAYDLLLAVVSAVSGGATVERYESLVDRPAERLARLLAFTGEGGRLLPFIEGHSAELRPTHSVAGNPSRFTSGSIEIRADEAWRTEMPAGSRRLVTAIAWPGLLRHGYFGGGA